MTDLIEPVQRQPRREVSFTIDLSGVAEQLTELRRAFEAFGESLARLTGRLISFDELCRTPAQILPIPDITVEFGPQNWIHEIRRIPSPPLQFPRQWPQLLVSPIEYDVDAHWQQFTAPDFPVPDRPGYDFARYVPDDGPLVWAAPPPAPHHTRRPATARRAPRRGRSRR